MQNILFVPLLLGCGGHIKDLYDKEQQQVRLKSTTIPANWKPDARLRINYSVIDQLAKKNLQKSLRRGKFQFRPLGMKIVINTTNTIKKIKVSDHKRDDSFVFSAQLKGKGSWNSAILKGATPYTAHIKGRAKISFENSRFFAKISHIDTLQLTTKKNRKDKP